MAVSMGVAQGISVIPRDVKVEHDNENLAVGMTLDLAAIPVKSTMSVTVTPVLRGNGGERLELTPVTVAGRSRYNTLLRERDDRSETAMFYRYAKDMAPMQYAVIVPYAVWMKGSELTIETDTEGCCSKDLGQTSATIERLNFTDAVFTAEYAYVTPSVEAVKVREIEGEAFVDFKVNQTIILPDFGRNPGELAKIRQSIDAIRDNDDTKIISMTITGFASPEGPYANNERLAKGRTEALADYVATLYKFPSGLITTSSVAEDWVGVKRFLEDNPSFENRDAILSLINGEIEPDALDARIKTEYPSAYKYMLDNVYPPLRHTEYKVGYEVRSYTDPKEIAEIFRTRPSNLSLQEMYVLAASLPEGSDEYAEVFETAAKLFPDSETAALNAAFAGMKRGDYVGAARHLAKAGQSTEAVYARGLMAAYDGDYAKARDLIAKAAEQGLVQAQAALISLPSPE